MDRPRIDDCPGAYAGSGGAPTPSPFIKAPPGPVRQLSGGIPMARSLTDMGSGQLGSGMGSGQLGRAGSGAFSPSARLNSSGLQAGVPEGMFGLSVPYKQSAHPLQEQSVLTDT